VLPFQAEGGAIMGNKGRGPNSPWGRKHAAELAGKPAAVDAGEARRTVDSLTPQAEAAVMPEIETTRKAEAGEESNSRTGTGSDPAGARGPEPLFLESVQGGKLAESLATVQPQVLEPWLWLPLSLGGGDVAMLCKFSEAQIQLLRVRAEEQSRTEGEILQELFARAFEYAWV
jgi:hypothetical protein